MRYLSRRDHVYYYPSNRHHRPNGHRFSTTSERVYDGSKSYGTQGSWINGPDQPAPSAAALRNLQDKQAHPREATKRLDLEEAFGLAHEALGSMKMTSIPCLSHSSRAVRYSGHDLPFMVFDDLDKNLFRSVLKGNVYLKWTSLPRGIFARTSRPGLHGRPRTTIELSEDVAGHLEATLGILLHQMIHAYYIQCCGHKNKRVAGKGHSLSHKEEFWSLRLSLKEHFLPGEGNVWGASKDSRSGMSRNISRHHAFTPGSSNCYCGQSRSRPNEVSLWRKLAIQGAKTASIARAMSSYGDGSSSNSSANRITESDKFNFIERDGSSYRHEARSECPFAKGTYMIIQYEKGPYPIFRKPFHGQEAISKSPFYHDNVLNFPSTSSWEDFKILYFYLKEGDFAPTRDSALAASQNALPAGSSLNTLTGQGPPTILDTIANSPDYLAASISAYMLAGLLHFEPLKNAAIKRLYALPCACEDPIVLLRQIYASGSSLPQDDKLRIWVRDWLSRVVDATMPVDFKERYPTNIHFLKMHHQIGQKLEQLVQANPNLLHDVSEAEKVVINRLSPLHAAQERDYWPPTNVQHASHFPFAISHNVPGFNLFSQWPYPLPQQAGFDILYQNLQRQQVAQGQRAPNSQRVEFAGSPDARQIEELIRRYSGLSVEDQQRIWEQYP